MSIHCKLQSKNVIQKNQVQVNEDNVLYQTNQYTYIYYKITSNKNAFRLKKSDQIK